MYFKENESHGLTVHDQSGFIDAAATHGAKAQRGSEIESMFAELATGFSEHRVHAAISTVGELTRQRRIGEVAECMGRCRCAWA
jgi:hypothetical protein